MYEPDRVFVKDLKKLDPNLGCHYEKGHQHFVITYKRAIGGKIPIMMVSDENNGFRQPDRRDIIKLKESDTQNQSAQSRMKATATYMERVREKERKKARELIRERTKDDKLQLAPKFARLGNPGGKFNSTFRRIDLKPKGISAKKIKPLNN